MIITIKTWRGYPIESHQRKIKRKVNKYSKHMGVELDDMTHMNTWGFWRTMVTFRSPNINTTEYTLENKIINKWDILDLIDRSKSKSSLREDILKLYEGEKS